MAARYLNAPSFVIQLASGASHSVIMGAHRDSAHAAVTGTPAAWWTTTPLSTPAIDPKLAQYLTSYPDAQVS